ncbi:LysR family transcriptional regulator [Novosphingobium endophyticum]|uniref:LysR family transcriptional regulator n=1 Tax=Novosphingobium endophyticum TaxID=1955250 RepID=A0A916TNK2_9SPHN|nr:LysR family transcriptional regulator [Novosphingobium endophyticum]GGB85873.1 LysR family transcriptional regulator [Novosphingobium endophyticum]
MDTAHLKAFLRIAETGSISRAAQSLGIAQPSLSQQLLRLEDEVGLRLFDRTARGVTLTEAGRVFLEHARMMLLSAERAIADTLRLRGEAQGQVIVAMPPSVARLVGSRLIEALEVQSPLVRVRVVEAYNGTIRGWLEAEKIDLGIMYDLHTLRHLTPNRLFSEELFVVAPYGQFGTASEPGLIDFAQLAASRLALPGPQHGLRQLLEREAASNNTGLQVRYDVDSLPTLLDLVEHGRALSVLPSCVALAEARAERISVARLGLTGMHRTMSLVRNPSHVLTHASVRVENLLHSLLRALADGGWDAHIEKNSTQEKEVTS